MDILKSIRNIKKLQPGWKGKGSIPPDKKTYNNALLFLRSSVVFNFQPNAIIPVRFGAIGFYFANSKDRFAYVEFNKRIYELMFSSLNQVYSYECKPSKYKETLVKIYEHVNK